MDPMALLNQYKRFYGDIIFPNGSDVHKLLDVYRYPWSYLYSYDGIHWMQTPVDIGKIGYQSCLFREKPNGIYVGVTKEIQQNPHNYLVSYDNGYTWDSLPNMDWVYHGKHESIWFKRKEMDNEGSMGKNQ